MLKTKLMAFGVSSFYCGVAGALWAFAYLGSVEPQAFDLNRSFQILFTSIAVAAATMVERVLGFFGHLPGAIGRNARDAQGKVREMRRGMQEQLDKLRGKKVDVRIGASFKPPKGLSVHDIVGARGGLATPGGIRRARGGPVWGAGTATSDSIPAMLSNGEYVVNAGAVRRHRPLLEAINARRMASGGLVDIGAATSMGGVPGAVGASDRALRRAAAIMARAFAGKVAHALAGAFAAVAPRNVSGAVAVGRRMAAARGWTGRQWDALYRLWSAESGWRWNADNPTSSAYGIPQALPGSKMASAGRDWRTNAATQIRWGLGYIAGRYRTPLRAWQAWQARRPHWYHGGGILPEDVFGMGPSGATYGLQAGERVVPRGTAAAVVVNVDLRGATLLGDARKVANDLAPRMESAIREGQRRRGVPAGRQLP